MTLPPDVLVTLLGAPLLAGIAALRLLRIGPAGDRASFAAWAWLLGAFVAALMTFAWLVLAKPMNGRWLAPLLGLAAVAVIAGTRKRAMRVSAGDGLVAAARGERIAYGAVVVALVAALLVHSFALNVQPVLYGDEANIFAQKAKAMVSVPRLDLDYVYRQAHWDVKHIDYPLFAPMLHAWVYAAAGKITLVDNRWPLQLFAFALLVVLGGALRRRVRPAVAAGLLVWFFGMGVLDQKILLGEARADVLLLVAFLVAVDSWLRWCDDAKPQWWALSCIGLGTSLWAKNEGALLCVAFVCAVALARIARAVPGVLPRGGGRWLALPAAVLALHKAFNAYLGVGNDLFDPHTAGSQMSFWERAAGWLGDRAPEVLRYYWCELILAPGQLGLVVALALGALLCAPRALLRSPAIVPLATALIALAGYHVVFVATPFDLAWHMPTAADRTVLHVVPMCLVWIAAVAGPIAAPRAPRRPA